MPAFKLPAEEAFIKFMAEDTGNGTASNAIWAVVLVLIVAMIVGAVYYSGVLRSAPGGSKTDVDIKVNPPR